VWIVLLHEVEFDVVVLNREENERSNEEEVINEHIVVYHIEEARLLHKSFPLVAETKSYKN
jgi:hypothetical protein